MNPTTVRATATGNPKNISVSYIPLYINIIEYKFTLLTLYNPYRQAYTAYCRYLCSRPGMDRTDARSRTRRNLYDRMDELKYKIIDKAKELFLKYGLRSVTIDDICRDLRISKKTFYSVLKGKEELIETVLEQMRTQNSKSSAEECDDVIKDLAEAFRQMKRNGLVEKHINLFFDLEKYYPSILDRHRVLSKKAEINNTIRRIRLGIAQGYFREDMNVETTSVILNTLNISEVYMILKKNMGLTMTQIMDALIDMYIRILANSKGMAHYQELKEQWRQ